MTKSLSTRDLVRGEHSLAVVRPGKGRRLFWASLVMLLGSCALLYQGFHYSAALKWQLTQLEQDNARLQAELERIEMSRLEVSATQAQLERRNADLTDQVRKLKTELAFFRQQKR